LDQPVLGRSGVAISGELGVGVSALQQYKAYLESVDEEAKVTPADQYLDLLTPGEVVDLLLVRDEIDELQLTSEDLVERDRLDDLLLKHSTLVVDDIPPFPDKPRAHWWWHLHEGPQVRRDAEAQRMKQAS
jgi:hypothetical protein